MSSQKKKRRNALRDDDRPTKRATSLAAPKNDGKGSKPRRAIENKGRRREKDFVTSPSEEEEGPFYEEY